MNLLKQAWEKWKAFGELIGNLVARVVLTLFYFTIFLPFGLGVTLLSDPLSIRKDSSRGWVGRESMASTPENFTLEKAMRQY